MNDIKLLFDGTEFLKQSTNGNPYEIFTNKILLAPGEWNDNKYTPLEIEKAYKNTDWKDKSNYSLYLDHQDTKERGVGNWAGYVKNIHLDESKRLIGDLEVWNPALIVYLKEAEAKFGISVTLKGTENNNDNKMQDFKFESFSIVTNPACKESWINLSENLKPNERRYKIITMAEKVENKNQPISDEEQKKIDEEKKKKEEEEVEEQNSKKKKDKEDVEDENLNDSSETIFEMLSSMDKVELSAYTDFVAKMRNKDPKISFKEIAKAWSSQKKMSEELSSSSDIELLDQIASRYEILRKRCKYPEAQMKEQSDKMNELSQTMKEVNNEVKELKEKLKEPERKTLRTSNSASPINMDPVAAMTSFLQSGGQGSFSI